MKKLQVVWPVGMSFLTCFVQVEGAVRGFVKAGTTLIKAQRGSRSTAACQTCAIFGSFGCADFYFGIKQHHDKRGQSEMVGLIELMFLMRQRSRMLIALRTTTGIALSLGRWH
jgi:hypothetical protein